MEPFKPGQKGSSAMPHKRNPILSERIAGLARLLRGYAQAGLENQPLWHERDISHSSAERVALPDATTLLDYMLVRTTSLGRGPGGAAGADAREHRARPGPARVVAGAAGPRRARRALARGRLRHRPAQRPAGRRRARAAPAPPRRRTRWWPRSCRWPSSTPASTTPRCSATCLRSSRRLDRLEVVRATALRRSSAPARSATCIAWATTGCCWSRPTACRRSTWSCRRRSPTRAACSPASRATGSRRRRPSCPTTCCRRTRPTSRPRSPTATPTWPTTLRGRMMLGRLAEVLPIECVVRGYLSGSGWKAYLDDGAVCGIQLPARLRESDRLPAPIFTPATKAPMGEHDENIPFESVETLIGPELAARVRDVSLALYRHGAEVVRAGGDRPRRHQVRVRAAAVGRAAAHRRGADPGLEPLLGRRGLSSPAGRRRASTSSTSATGCSARTGTGRHPGPSSRCDVVAGTRARYVAAFERITGASFDRYLTEDVIAR